MAKTSIFGGCTLKVCKHPQRLHCNLWRLPATVFSFNTGPIWKKTASPLVILTQKHGKKGSINTGNIHPYLSEPLKSSRTHGLARGSAQKPWFGYLVVWLLNNVINGTHEWMLTWSAARREDISKKIVHQAQAMTSYCISKIFSCYCRKMMNYDKLHL